MPLFITSLNSGSNGNCYYVGNRNEAVLVDAGIPCREIEVRLRKLNLDIRLVRAVFVSHEHTDHITGLSVLSKKYQLPVYITEETLLHSGLRLQRHLVSSFDAVQPVTIGSLTVKAFQKFHDAKDPHSFMISCADINVGVFTDIGRPCDQLINHFKLCHAAFLEANYDDEMLAKGRYPYFLKNRIRGGNGHLSNVQALNLFNEHRPVFMSHLLLSHLSKENNSPELVKELFHTHANGTKIIVASRYESTEVYEVDASVINAPVSTRLYKQPVKASMQLSLF